MDDSLAISIRNVSKKYRLYGSARERLFEALHPFKRKYHKEFWALRDVSFDVAKGTTVGIVGRNGMGKSTLLQIICSILRPTSGTVEVNGRVAALLELGAGFNTQFTGRQNVMFSGQLMGLSEAEMKGRMSDIEAFADIGEFIDQPVKTYSSGMFVRLAFAAAINVDPDILVVDEALAVGDAKFQHKCYMKFHEFQEAGKTIIFVTHDTNTLVRHSHRAILLHYGQAVHIGAPKDVVNRYLDILEGRDAPAASAATEQPAKQPEAGAAGAESPLEAFCREVPDGDRCSRRRNYNEHEYRQGFQRAEILDYLVVRGQQHDPVIVCCGDVVDVYIKARFHEEVIQPAFGIAVKSVDGVVLFGYNSAFAKLTLSPAAASDCIVFKFSLKLNVAAGDVFMDIGVDEKVNSRTVESLDRRCAIIHLNVEEKLYFDGLNYMEPECEEVARQTTQG